VEKKLPEGTNNWYEAIDLIHRRAKHLAFSQYPNSMTDAAALRDMNPDAPKRPAAGAPAAPQGGAKAERKKRLDALQD
jgi:hypothetical protein